MANNSSPTPIVIDESTYISISEAPECNEPTPLPPASITTPSSPQALLIPPRYSDPFLDNLFDPDFPVSPVSSYTQLEHLGDCLTPEPRAIMAQKVAQAALKRAHKVQGESDQRQAALDMVTAK